MSKLEASIKNIESLKTLNIVTFDFFGLELKMMSLELEESMQVGKKVCLGIKPTSVAIAKDLSGVLSYSNQINSTIKSMDMGELLCSIKLLACESVFESIITTASAKRMELKEGDSVVALIKANEISIVEVLS